MNISKTKNNLDVVYASNDGYCSILDYIDSNFANVIDYQDIDPQNICNFTRYALDNLPKKDCIILIHLTEAFSSVYWNIVFDIVKNYGIKKIIWVDAGLTPGYMYRHVSDLSISHKTSNYFFTRLLNEKNNMYSEKLLFKERKHHFVSLARLTRQERVYFASKITEDEELSKKGIISCGWGNNEKNSIWGNNYDLKIAEEITGNDVSKFPISLGDDDNEQYDVLHNFDLAVFNIVQESSVGFNSISHHNSYSDNPYWFTIDSDRHFFTEKSAKPFLMGQIPLFIASPGYVEQLRKLGFDVFDDIVQHDYDREDFVINRCNKCYQELKKLSLQDIKHLSDNIKNNLMDRLQNNLNLCIDLGNEEKLAEWINNQIA